MSQIPQFDEPKSSKLGITTLVARFVTLISLIIAIVILKISDVTAEGYETITYKHFTTYQYVFFSMVIGFAYTVIQISFAIYYLTTGKRLFNRYVFRQYDFYGDKAGSFLLATGVGAAFGATMELSKLKYDGALKSKFDDFYSMVFLSAGFLLIAFLSSCVSSIISSSTLSKG